MRDGARHERTSGRELARENRYERASMNGCKRASTNKRVRASMRTGARDQKYRSVDIDWFTRERVGARDSNLSLNVTSIGPFQLPGENKGLGEN